MDRPASNRDYLNDLKGFLAFQKNLWVLLAGISVFFPFSNILLAAIPLGAYGIDGGVFDQLAPALITAIATIATFFMILVTFAGRSQFQSLGKRRTLLRRALLSFAGGILSLLTYLIIHQAYHEYAWDSWGWGSGDPRKLLAEIPLLITYVMFFSLLTRAFMILAMIEFYGKGAVHGRSGR
jgi:hypothetical protein